MKIVFVIDSWNPGNGCIVATHRLADELQQRGHEISLVCTAGKSASEFDGDVFEVPGFYLPGVKESMINMDFQFGKGVKKTLKKAFTGADLVQIQFPYFMAANAVRTAKKMNIPVLAGCHIQSQNMTGAMGKDNKLGDLFFNTWFNYELFKRVDAIHCPSTFAAELRQELGSKAHMRVVSNGIPHEYISMDAPQRPEIFEDKFVLINIGRYALEKRQGLMIEAVKKSKYKDDIKLMICGKGEEEENMRASGRDLPVEPFLGYISMEEKLLYLNTADMYLHSSEIELESLSCLEALGCGLPCLIADSPNSAASQFGMDDRFIFKMDDADDLARKIDFWYENRQELKGMREKTLAFAEPFRMRNSIDAMERLYEDMLSRDMNRIPAETIQQETAISNEQIIIEEKISVGV